MRSASSASQATMFRKKSWLPWKPRSAFDAKSASPIATTRPSVAFGSSGARATARARASGVGAGAGPFTVATAASEIGPLRSLPSSNLIGSLSVEVASPPRTAREVFTRFWAVTPSTVALPACDAARAAVERSAAGSPW